MFKSIVSIKTFLFLVLPLFAVSQTNQAGTQNNPQTDMFFQNLNLDYRNIYMDSQKRQAGNSEPVAVYLKENWNNKLAILTIENRTMVLGSSNYNITSGKFEVKASKDSVFIMESSAIKELKFNDKKFVKPPGKSRYYEELFVGENVGLYKVYNYKLKEAAVDPMSLRKLGEDKVIVTEIFSFKMNNEVRNIELKKKSILKALKDKKSEIISYEIENKLNFKEIEDVIRIFKFYDSL